MQQSFKMHIRVNQKASRILTVSRLNFFILILLTFIVTWFFISSFSVTQMKDQAVDQLTKFKDKVVNLTFGDPRLVENLFKAKYKPRFDGKTIFFLETNLDENSTLININARQACSIEAAAQTHPDYDVFLIYFREVGFFNTTPLPLIDAIMSYKNVHLRSMNIYDYTENTPLESWMETGILFNSTYFLWHTSDILRILTLWRYTGTYLDLDIIIRKRIDSIGPNFACVQQESLINSAVTNFDSLLGREIAEKIFDKTIKNFDPKKWVDNGPGILTSVLRERCNNKDNFKMTRENCKGFLVLPPPACFAINPIDYKMFFEEKYRKETLEKTKDSFVIHTWNSYSRKVTLSTKTKSAYLDIAKESCPRVLKAAGEYF